MTNGKWQMQVRSPSDKLRFAIFHWSLVICHWQISLRILPHLRGEIFFGVAACCSEFIGVL